MAAYEFAKYKWGPTAFGTSGSQVTWSFASVAGKFFAFDAAITAPVFQNLVREAFNAWEQVANIDFMEVGDSASSDIRLGWDAIDGRYDIIGQAQYTYQLTSTEYRPILQAEIRFDSAEDWATTYVAGPDASSFYATALHEIGHAIGLAHTEDPNTVMYAYQTTQSELTVGDITGSQLLYGARPSALMSTVYNGTAGDDFYVGNPANETIYGFSGNDLLAGDGGNDRIEGGVGLDHAGYDLDRGRYQVTKQPDGAITVVDRSAGAAEGTDFLVNIERLNFADGFLAFDLQGNAGQAYRLYQAAFDRTPDVPGLGYWIRELDEGSVDLISMAFGFMVSDEFRETYGSPVSVSNGDFLNLLYHNVLNRDAEGAGFSYWMRELEGGVTREGVLASFSESAENQANVAAEIESGIWYT